jgi:hypothetical protein
VTEPTTTGDLATRVAARLDVQRCPGATTAGDTGMEHCAECCFGSGFAVTSQEELDDLLLIRDLADEVRALRAEVEAWREGAAIGPEDTP